MTYGNGQGLSLLQELEAAKEDPERVTYIITDLEAQQNFENERISLSLRKFKNYKKMRSKKWKMRFKKRKINCSKAFANRQAYVITTFQELFIYFASFFDAYLNIRNRFTDIYRLRRDKSQSVRRWISTRNIVKGNLRTHGREDALMFHSAQRVDPEIFLKIYEVFFEHVLLLRKCDEWLSPWSKFMLFRRIQKPRSNRHNQQVWNFENWKKAIHARRNTISVYDEFHQNFTNRFNTKAYWWFAIYDVFYLWHVKSYKTDIKVDKIWNFKSWKRAIHARRNMISAYDEFHQSFTSRSNTKASKWSAVNHGRIISEVYRHHSKI